MKAITKDLEFCGIYMLLNTKNGKRYIGSSINIRKRLWEHRALLRHNKHDNPHLQNAWNKYGEDFFEYSVLEKCDKDIRFIREQFYVNTLHPEYNICIDIVNNPPCSIQTRKKHSETRKRLMAEGIIKITHNTPVYVYYKDGSFVGYWESIRKAAKELNIHYSSACKVLQGYNFQCKGYKFFTKKQEFVEPFKKPTNISIAKIYIVDDGEKQLEFIGINSIAKYFNTTKGNINIHIVKRIKFHKKYMIYKKCAVS